VVSTILEDVVAGRAPGLFPITVDQYLRMVETGILAEGSAVELHEGAIVRKDRSENGGDPNVHGVRHAYVVKCLERVAPRVDPLRAHIQAQLPITLSTHDAPEPDLAIVRGQPSDYLSRHPSADDLLLVVEVSDSSLLFDRTAKLRLYARHAVPVYWIVNLPEGCVETHAGPIAAEERYARVERWTRGDTLRLDFDAGTLEVPVAAILPPPLA
jgi:Uma2 family endonuclease